MLMRFDPFRELDRLADEVAGGARRAVMPMDAYRQGDRFLVEFDLPGVDGSSIELTVEKNVLTVSAERAWRRDENTEVIASERPHGHFTRQLFLGESLNTDAIEARYADGVLRLAIPVAESAKPRKIEIEAGDSPKAITAEVAA
jgi:HSP20 family protein